ncbi:hypothetical protein MCEMZLE14_00392 [Candidatus Nanopelagicaceae bacterium]
MELILFWLILSVLAGVYAGTKGRSGFGWFCFSFFLSPLIGFIALAIIPTRSKGTTLAVPNPTRDKLLEIKQLLNEGLISQDEYVARRKMILESTDS